MTAEGQSSGKAGDHNRPAPSPLLLAAGLLVVTATQLRFRGPVGPGECFLLAWAGLALWRSSVRRSRLPTLLMMFLVLSAVALVGGYLAARYLDLAAPDAGRQSAALLFAAVLMVSTALARPDLVRDVGRSLLVLAGAVLGGLYLLALFGVDLRFVDPWWPQFGRFRGWAANPNQLAFVLSPLPFLALAVLRDRWGRGVFAASIAVIWLALATGSKSLPLVWAVGSVSLWIVCRRRLKSTVSDAVGRSGVALLGAMLLISALYIGIVWPVHMDGKAIFGSSLPWTMQEDARPLGRRSQLDVRLRLAANGLVAGTASPIFGLGPGSHSGLGGPHRGRGSHNSAIDWWTETGLVGLAVLAAIVAVAAVRLWQTRPLLLPVMFCLVAYAQFHDILRQPLWWVFLALSLCGSVRGEGARHASFNKTSSRKARLSKGRCR